MMDSFASNFTDGLLFNSSGDPSSALDDIHRCHPLNEHFNCTEQEYLVFNRGPQTLQLYIVLPVTIMYVGTFIAGIVGNAIVCIVIIRHSSMHTATNYYLFSLAVSDLIYLLFGLPFDLSVFWYQYPYVMGQTFCKLRALISEASTYVSVLTIVAFSMERYLAVCHPLHLYAMSGFKRAVRIIAVLWVVSFISAIPFGVYSKISYVHYPPGNDSDENRIMDSAFCAMLSNPPGFPLWEFSSLVFFVIPMAVMMILYGRMGLQIRFRSKHTSVLGVQQGSMHGESKHAQNRKAIIRMLAAVVITFFVSWAPFHAQRLLFLHGQHWDHYILINEWLFYVAGLFYYFSCTINPILYNVMSNRYRVAFRETLCGRQRSFYQHNGFSRDAQSSVRETMISGTGGYEKTQLARIRSMRQSMRYNNDRVDGKNTWANKSLLTDHIEEKPSDNLTHIEPPPSHRCAGTVATASDVVVVVPSNQTNGRPKCYATQPMSGIAAAMPAASTNGKVKGGGGGSLTTVNHSSSNNHHHGTTNNNSLDKRPLSSDDGSETCI